MEKKQKKKPNAINNNTQSAPNINRKSIGSNWNAASSTNKCKETANNNNNNNNNNVKTMDKNISNKDDPAKEVVILATESASKKSADCNDKEDIKKSKSARQREKRKAQRNNYVAMDCEMVGIGANGQDDMLARVSIVNRQGEVLLDKYVKPTDVVTDYRTSVSGIRPADIENAEEFDVVQDQVLELLQGKILVGHAIRNDLGVLRIKHSYSYVRDTSTYKPLCKLVANGHTPSLKRLSQVILGLEIQKGEHSSIEDARAAMSIYNRLAPDWEQYIEARCQRHRRHNPHHHHHRPQHQEN